MGLCPLPRAMWGICTPVWSHHLQKEKAEIRGAAGCQTSGMKISTHIWIPKEFHIFLAMRKTWQGCSQGKSAWSHVLKHRISISNTKNYPRWKNLAEERLRREKRAVHRR